MSFEYKPAENPGLVFQPCQLVCLEHQTARLYAEVVQVVESRQVCWVRPLALVEESENTSTFHSEYVNGWSLHDLRYGSDLLLPALLFRVALDTEVIPLLATLFSLESGMEGSKLTNGHQKLNQLINEICLASPEMFRSAFPC